MEKKNQPTAEKLPFYRKLLFGVGDSTFSLYFTVVAFFYLFFLTDVVGIKPVLAGAVLFVGKAWDEVTRGEEEAFPPLRGSPRCVPVYPYMAKIPDRKPNVALFCLHWDKPPLLDILYNTCDPIRRPYAGALPRLRRPNLPHQY